MLYLRVLIMLVTVCMAPLAVTAETQTGKNVVIHVTSVPGDDASRFYSIARLAITALEKGDKVTLLFDGKGARSVRLGSWYGGDTSLLDKLDITEAERESLASTLGLTVASTPSNYGDLFRLLRGKGAKLYVNSDMVSLLGIKDEEFDTVFTKAKSAKMLEIFERADVYVSY